MSPRESQVLHVLAESQQGMTLAEIAAEIGGITPKVVSSVIYQLRAAGHVKQVGHGASPSGGGRRVGIWRVSDWRVAWRPRPDVAAAWIIRGGAA